MKGVTLVTAYHPILPEVSIRKHYQYIFAIGQHAVLASFDT